MFGKLSKVTILAMAGGRGGMLNRFRQMIEIANEQERKEIEDSIRKASEFEADMENIKGIIDEFAFENVHKLGITSEELASACFTFTKEPEELSDENAIKKQIKNLKRERKRANFLRQQQIDREINDLKRRK